jgi:hypothetical protein
LTETAGSAACDEALAAGFIDAADADADDADSAGAAVGAANAACPNVVNPPNTTATVFPFRHIRLNGCAARTDVLTFTPIVFEILNLTNDNTTHYYLKECIVTLKGFDGCGF